MAKKVRVKLNKAGVRKLAMSDDMRLKMLVIAEEIADRAGEGFEADSFIGRNRARASVRTKTYEAKKEEATNRSLTKAFNSIKGSTI